MNHCFQKNNAFVAIISLGIVLVTIGLQFWAELIPCGLCYIQRYLLLGIVVLALIASLPILSRRMQRVFAISNILISFLGLATAAHHVRLQMLPSDQMPSCLPSSEYLLAHFPIMEALEMILRGDHSCSDPSWMFLGISLAGWAGVVFGAILLNYLFWAFKGLR